MAGGPAVAQDGIFSDDFESGDTGRWSYVQGPAPEAFRFSDVDMRDPHFFVDLPFVGCTDVTDNGVAGVIPSMNEWIEASVTEDGDGDGLLDHSYVMIFRPFSPGVTDGSMRIVEGDCTAPMGTTTCAQTPDTDYAVAVYDGFPAGPCLSPSGGTTSGYVPAVEEPISPCFTTHQSTFFVNLNGLLLPLTSVQFGGTPDADPETEFSRGLFMGFLTEADANDVEIPADLPLIGGQPLSSILPGGTNCCAAGDDREMWDGEMGWWIYMNFEADVVPYTD